jgi:hypothetical protein
MFQLSLSTGSTEKWTYFLSSALLRSSRFVFPFFWSALTRSNFPCHETNQRLEQPGDSAQTFVSGLRIGWADISGVELGPSLAGRLPGYLPASQLVGPFGVEP